MSKKITHAVAVSIIWVVWHITFVLNAIGGLIVMIPLGLYSIIRISIRNRALVTPEEAYAIGEELGAILWWPLIIVTMLVLVVRGEMSMRIVKTSRF